VESIKKNMSDTLRIRDETTRAVLGEESRCLICDCFSLGQRRSSMEDIA
jgi:hypothetical protein